MRIRLPVVAAAAVSAIVIILCLYLIPTRSTARVARVIDGDTIETTGGGRIRLLGIDAQEKGEEFYAAATDRLRELVEGRTVELESDVTDEDKYGRLLRYVFVGGKSVNLQMVEEGLAYTFVISPDLKYLDEFSEAEKRARNGALNIWKDAADRCISVEFNPNARGNDNDNLNDEYVTFKNLCNQDTPMEGWEVKDGDGNSFRFPRFVMCGGCVAVLYSGSGEESGNRFYWGSDMAIWDNGGETLRLYDSHGKMIIEETY